MSITYYWNNKLDPKYHVNMWTNRICTEKLLKENINKETHIFFITSPKDNDDVFEVIDSVVGKNYKLVVWLLDHSTVDDYYDGRILQLHQMGEDIIKISPDMNIKNDYPFKILNNYSMADPVLEQQQNDRKLIMGLFEKSEKWGRQKHFLSLNGNPKGHRIVLLAHILNNNLFEKFDISFNSFFWNEDVNFEHLDEYNFEKFDTSILPLDLDLKKTTPYTSTFLNIVLYFHSYIDVVTMAEYDNKGVYLDEKIYKSFACLKPFIVAGQYKTLEVLKKWGFKTFSSIFNEEYDNERNYVKRMNMICDEIKRLGNLSLEEVDDMYWNIKDILLYNFSHLGRFIHEIDKNLLKEVVK